MKKTKKFKSKILMFIFALILPLSATGIAYISTNVENAKADSSSTSYYSGYMKEKSITNNNFNSSSSTYSLSNSLSGWTGQVTDKKSTSGIIDVGNTFQNYMTGTYRLSQNPSAKATDKKILMINSKYADSTNLSSSRQGYKSSSISLDANSYYTFQVSFKSDTNYESTTDYVLQNEKLAEGDNITISADSFKGKAFDDYIAFSYKTKTYYFKKTLTEHGTASAKTLTESEILYEDDDYIGYLDTEDETRMLFVEKIEDKIIEDGGYTIDEGVTTYKTYFTYNKTNKEFTAPAGTEYYLAKTTYKPLDYYSFGSIYLSGLKDSNGNAVKAEYIKVSSIEWVTFYFFVATGDESQSVSLDLWLGSKTVGQNSSGVVFYDDVHVYQYSENTFWKLYNSYYGKNYTQSNEDSTEKVECVNLVDLRNYQTFDYPTHNFNFEAGEYQNNGTAVKNWKQSGTGNARVFNTNAPAAFKKITGFEFVGSTLSCDVELDDDLKPTIEANNYALGLWANNQYVDVKSNDIAIGSNEIVKITAYYKVSEITSGKVYMSIEENDNVYAAYNLKESQYTLSDRKTSSGTTSNGSSAFNNNYGTIEFYVKGGTHYDTSFNILLGLGKSDEQAIGCVLFDNITIEKATTADFESATNKVEFDAAESSEESGFKNSSFNKVTINEDDTLPYAPQNWTITSEEDAFVFGGVINTEASKYATYKDLYNQNGGYNVDNPYAWAYATNPKNSEDSDAHPDNILMLANLESSYQTLKSENITLEAGKVSKIDFMMKTSSDAKATISVYGSDGFKIYETKLGTNNTWKSFELYLNAITGANEVYVEISLGSSNEKMQGFAYVDNFNLETDIAATVFESKKDALDGVDFYGAVDMSDFYLNLPTNDIKDELGSSVTPGYTTSLGRKDDGVEINGGIVKSSAFASNSPFYIENQDEKVFYITSSGKGSYSIDSKFNLDLTADSYYKLTFKLKTNFAYTNPEYSLDEEKTYNYGVTVGLSNFDYANNLVSNDEFKEYTIYFKPTEDTSSTLHISLICDSVETSGSMALYDIALENLEEEAGKEEYDAASDVVNSDDYDVNTSAQFVATETEETSDDSTEEETTDAETSGNSDLNWSILISSLITGAAIIIAIVGWALKKVKIKKIEKKRKESYDRKSSLDVDLIKRKARNQRDAEVAEIKKTAEKFENELASLETAHKRRVVELREKDKGKVSKETDKEFKQFAQKRTVIAEKLDSLNKQIENVKSPEYLLNLERKIYAQEEAKRKELAKISKKSNKTYKNEK